MKIFISWAGDRAKLVAEILHDWLPRVIQSVSPWLSQNMEKGSRWAIELSTVLQGTDFGIICLTPENTAEPWIHFEAGALSKLSEARVCTYLVGLEKSDVVAPLSMFQHTSAADKADTEKLVQSINGATKLPLESRRLKEAFDLVWPKLEAELAKIGDAKPAPPPPSKTERMLEEVLEITRGIARKPITTYSPYRLFPSSSPGNSYFVSPGPFDPETLLKVSINEEIPVELVPRDIVVEAGEGKRRKRVPKVSGKPKKTPKGPGS